MEDDSKFGSMVKWGLGAVGLGGVAAVIAVPSSFKIWVAVAILVLFILFFGGYFLWRRLQSRRQSKMFSSAIEAQTAAAPRAISDPNQRAALDKLRQKFQSGMQEFKTRGKDIYKLPWYVIIGESGSGKSEAIRHSGIEFPPGLQDEMQGSGGTVNMDWWFTNRAIILDTAGSMIFREQQAGASPEWGEFLRLLKKSRPQCPINGLFLVLSIESLIHDSADKISEKASKLAQQLQLIQRTLDVRFPVYLLVTKADLLTGFREFFDNIEDPLLQHQMFGWSNPDPLDSHLRADLVEQHLKSMADRLRRRRLALILREPAAGARLGETSFLSASTQPLGGRLGQRRLDDMDALFALPESVMRLVPRLRRYLETVFVAGEWSAKPVFLRGIYFTSSMREGKALDEAMALATGLSVDQLPEDRSWEKNRAFFLRDLFVDKVFRESGLVTRATNTIQLLRKRQFAIFGTAGVAMLLLIVLAGFGYRNLKRSVLVEAADWEAGAKGWNPDHSWSPPVVISGGADGYQFTYAGTNLAVPATAPRLSVIGYQQRLKGLASKPLAVSWIFKPFSWFGVGNVDKESRENAQRILFEYGVLKPLVVQTRNKIQGRELATSDPKAVDRHREALLSLIQLETDKYATNRGHLGGTNAAAKYFNSFFSYLTDNEMFPVDTNLVEVFASTYATRGSADGKWPPEHLLGGNRLSNNPAIKKGLDGIRDANRISVNRIEKEELPRLNTLADDLNHYRLLEHQWFTNSGDACRALTDELSRAMEQVENSRSEFLKVATDIAKPMPNLASCYQQLASASSKVSALSFSSITSGLSDAIKTEAGGLLAEIRKQLSAFDKEAASAVNTDYASRSNAIIELDLYYLAGSPSNATPAFESRSLLYRKACKLASESAMADDNSIGDQWSQFERLTTSAADFKKELAEYHGPYADRVQSACERIAGQAERQLKERYVENYVQFTRRKLDTMATAACSFRDVTNARPWLEKVRADLSQSAKLKEQAGKLDPVKVALEQAQKKIVQNYATCAFNALRPKLKFPLLLGSTETIDDRELKDVKSLLGRLSVELADPIWQSLPGSDEVLAPLGNSAKSFQNLVNSIIKPDDTLAEMEILFIPPATWNDEPTPRYAKLFVAGVELKISSPRPGDLTSFQKGIPITTKLPTGSGVRIEFFSDLERKIRTASFNAENWTLPRLIQEDQAEPINNNGKEWKLKLRVTVNNTSRTLETFQIRLEYPLPKKADWPK